MAAERVARYAHVETFLTELNALSSIVRVTGVARMRVSKLVKKAQQVDLPWPRLRPKKAQQRDWEALGLAEMWTFVGRKRHTVWLADERTSRSIVT